MRLTPAQNYQDYHYNLDALTLSDLKHLYQATNSVNIIEYVQNRYGVTGLIKLDMSVAVGIVSELLEYDIYQLLFNLNNCNTNDKDNYLELIYSIFIDIIDISSEYLDSDIRYEGVLKVLSELNLHPSYPMDENLHRSFVLNILDYTTHLDDADSGIKNDVVDALLQNNTLTTDDLFNWLKKYPIVAATYIKSYRDIMEENYKELPEDTIDRLGGIISYTKIAMLLFEYIRIANEYNEVSTIKIQVDDSVANIMVDLLDSISDLSSYTSKISFAQFMIDSTTYSQVNPSTTSTTLIQLLWSVWLKLNINEIEERDSYVDVFNSDISELYPTSQIWKSAISQGNTDGLVYALYYADFFKDYWSYNLELSDNKLNGDEYKSAVKLLIENKILPSNFLYSPKECVEKDLPQLFPDVKLFYQNGIKVTMSESNEDLLDSI